jgi:hypothetical protein
MTLSLLAHGAAVAVLLPLALQGVAVARADGGQGGGQAPKTKKQCLRILKAGRDDLAAERKAYPGRKKAALAKVTSQRAKLAALTAQHDAIAPQIDAIMNTNTEGLSESDVAAMNDRIEGLTGQERALRAKVDTAGGNVDEAVLASKALAAKYHDDVKNWPVQLEHIKSYCSKM